MNKKIKLLFSVDGLHIGVLSACGGDTKDADDKSSEKGTGGG